jgi:cobalamin biosynthesis protein CobD/CbiB
MPPSTPASKPVTEPVRAAGPACCGDIDLSKLGRCRYCVGLAAFLTIVSWTAHYFVRHKFALPLLNWAILIFACLVSLLLLAHVVAFFSKNRKGNTPLSEPSVDE